MFERLIHSLSNVDEDIIQDPQVKLSPLRLNPLRDLYSQPDTLFYFDIHNQRATTMLVHPNGKAEVQSSIVFDPKEHILKMLENTGVTPIIIYPRKHVFQILPPKTFLQLWDRVKYGIIPHSQFQKMLPRGGGPNYRMQIKVDDRVFKSIGQIKVLDEADYRKAAQPTWKASGQFTVDEILG